MDRAKLYKSILWRITMDEDEIRIEIMYDTGDELVDRAIGLCYDKGPYNDKVKRVNRITKVGYKNNHSSMLEFRFMVVKIGWHEREDHRMQALIGALPEKVKVTRYDKCAKLIINYRTFKEYGNMHLLDAIWRKR